MKNYGTHKFSKENILSIINGGRRSTQKLFIAAALFFISAGIFSGCKKTNDKKAVCRISSISITNGSSISGYNLSYNSDGTLSRITSGVTVTIYDYSGNTTMVTSLDSGRFSRKVIVTLNAAGLATNVRTEYNIAGTNWGNDAYEYNGEELTKSTNTSSGGGAPSVTNYTWFNGNLRSLVGASSLDYYTDRLRQAGDYISLYQLIQGYETIRTKNLLKSISTANSNTTITYEFGSDGNISSLVATAGGATTIADYQYQCN